MLIFMTTFTFLSKLLNEGILFLKHFLKMFRKKFKVLSPFAYPGANVFESIDLYYQAMLQSVVDLPKNIKLDVAARFVDSLAIWPLRPPVHRYFSLDLRIAWQHKKFEFLIVGKDLFNYAPNRIRGIAYTKKDIR